MLRTQRIQHALNAIARRGEFFLISRETGAHVALAGITKGGSGYDSHLVLRQQLTGEIAFAQAR